MGGEEEIHVCRKGWVELLWGWGMGGEEEIHVWGERGGLNCYGRWGVGGEEDIHVWGKGWVELCN